ncbi:MAG TPA: hypothetical protein VKT32_13155 [Chthonomonadaceae bacterium]|nr:hypothetical protein [Chthonomonadaceae bacterium]
MRLLDTILEWPFALSWWLCAASLLPLALTGLPAARAQDLASMSAGQKQGNGTQNGPPEAGKNPASEKNQTGPPAVNPGRPTITDPASLTAPGWLESEFGAQKDLDRDRNLGTPLLLKLTSGNNRLEYRLATDGYVHLGSGTNGFGDTYAALHYLFAPQEKAGYDLAGRITLKIPTASASLGTGKFDYNLLFLASRDFAHAKSGDVTLHGDFNVGIGSLSRQGFPGRDTQTLLSASFTFPIKGGRWQYTNELVYQSPIYGQRGEVTTMHGFSYALHPYDVYDFALQWQLHGDGANFQILFGRTFFFGRLF